MSTVMNPKHFLLSCLAVIEVSGDDSAQFLQGQLTIDIHQLAINDSSIAAFCNAKGRVISTLMVKRTKAGFLLVLPDCLLIKVIDKLRMYILRASVSLHNLTDSLAVYGVSYPQASERVSVELAEHSLKLPGSLARYLYLHSATAADSDNVIAQLSACTELSEWFYQDVTTGLPWLTSEQSEVFIPQMLGLDQLGGISFTKGCYTGQEIVARTHYLGQVKRQLFVAECAELNPPPAVGTTVLSADGQAQGQVFQAVNFKNSLHLLVILQQINMESDHLVLDKYPQSALKIKPAA